MLHHVTNDDSQTKGKNNTLKHTQSIIIQVDAVNDSRAEEGADGGVVVVVAGPKNCWKPVKPLFHHILHSNKNINNPSLLFPS